MGRRKVNDPDPVLKAELSWEPPPPRRQRYDWDAIATKLRNDPMVWAKVFDWDKTSLVNAIRQGAVRALDPALGFEVRTSNNQKEPVRMCTLFMRYNPARVDTLRATLHENRERQD